MIVIGQVKDSAGTLIPNVHVTSGAKGTTTNFDGEYHLEVNSFSILKFSHVGMSSPSYKATQVPKVVQLHDGGYNLAEVVLHAGQKPFYKTNGFKIGLATLFLGGLLLSNPKKSTGLNGYARVVI